MTKKTIAVIGSTGNIGAAIAKSLSKGNNRILLFSEEKEKTSELIETIRTVHPAADVEGISCAVNAGWEADVIILAVPYQAEREVAEKIRDVANQKIVISISNPLNDSYDGLLTHAGTSAAEELQKLLPNSKVVKAFNTTFAADFSEAIINGRQVDAFIAGNDDESVKIVSDLVSTAGFNPVIAGDLSISRTLEQMQLLLIRLTIKNNYNWHAGWKILHN